MSEELTVTARPEPTIQMEAQVKRLTERIGELSTHEGCYYLSDAAITPRLTAHVAICNGVLKDQGAPAAEFESLESACRRSLETAKALRDEIDGPAYLVWRRMPSLEYEPAIHHDSLAAKYGSGPRPATWSLYMRLCFEPM